MDKDVKGNVNTLTSDTNYNESQYTILYQFSEVTKEIQTIEATLPEKNNMKEKEITTAATVLLKLESMNVN